MYIFKNFNDPKTLVENYNTNELNELGDGAYLAANADILKLALSDIREFNKYSNKDVTVVKIEPIVYSYIGDISKLIISLLNIESKDVQDGTSTSKKTTGSYVLTDADKHIKIQADQINYLIHYSVQPKNLD